MAKRRAPCSMGRPIAGEEIRDRGFSDGGERWRSPQKHRPPVADRERLRWGLGENRPRTKKEVPAWLLPQGFVHSCPELLYGYNIKF